MSTITSHRLTKLVLRFLKEYGIYGDFYRYFKKYHPVYVQLNGGFYTYINNQVINRRYGLYDASLVFSVILDHYTDWLLENNKDAFNQFYDICWLMNLYLDEHGCNNGTTIITTPYRDINLTYSF